MPRQHQHPNQHESLASQLYKVPISPTGLQKKTWTLKLQPLQDTKKRYLGFAAIICFSNHHGGPGPQRFTTWTCQRFITTCFRPSLSLEKSLEPLHCSVQSHAVMLRPWHGHHDPRDTAHRGTPSHQLRWRPSQRSKILNLSQTRKWTGCISFNFLEIMAHISCFINLHCWLIVYGMGQLKICTISTSAKIFPPALPVPRTCHRPS